MRLSHHLIEVQTDRPFSIATGTTATFPVVVALLEHEGHVGLGEASPSRRVTGEDVQSVGQFLDWAATEVKDVKPEAWEGFLDHIHEDICGNPSARCALDLAMHDLIGKLRGVPTRTLYGLPKARMETCMTIGLEPPEDMAALAMDFRMRGFRVLKLKLGDADEDVARVDAVLRAVPDAAIRCDANTGWTKAEARRVLPHLADMGVEFVEQPVHPERMQDLVELSQWSPVPIYADESVLDIHDIERLAKAGFRGGMNLKLQKTGGIRPAIQAARRARELGYWVQLGCNVETAIGISAGVQLLSLLDHADLDGHLLLKGDPYVGANPVDGWYETSDAPGLGVNART